MTARSVPSITTVPTVLAVLLFGLLSVGLATVTTLVIVVPTATVAFTRTVRSRLVRPGARLAMV